MVFLQWRFLNNDDNNNINDNDNNNNSNDNNGNIFVIESGLRTANLDLLWQPILFAD